MAAANPPLRLLVIEDEALVALEIESILRDVGYEIVGIADSLDGALAIASGTRPDLALVDMHLAEGQSGLTLAAALKARGTPTLFVTGNCPAEAGAGLAIGCLHKPFSDRSLAGAVAVAGEILNGSTPETLPKAFHLF